MYEAVLEVNHWCHEKVTYKPSDARTSSPLASVKTAYGRCGEESTFTVAALRAVGIPARQVYTPRWAHTDDNHAWVEAWVDGKWYFLGACEPEPVLNLGWFNAPASRGMLMHTKVFGRYNGPEEVMSITPCFTEINVTSNYAPTEQVNIHITDKNGKPVDRAKVEFKLYNYAEFYTVAGKVSDSQGDVSLSAGKGDFLVWASKDGNYGFAKCSVGKDKKVVITLDKRSGLNDSIELDMVPPTGYDNAPRLTPEQIEKNKERLAHEDSIRNAYTATFITADKAEALAETLCIDKKILTKLLSASRGNYTTLIHFLQETSATNSTLALHLLQTLSEKDLRDVSIEVLRDHLAATPKGDHSDFYLKYMLNPRVSNEMLTPYKSFFKREIPSSTAASYRKDPEKWVVWCRKNIRIDNKWNPQQLFMTPKGVWNIRVTDALSRNVFFVAVARSMGIIARIDEVTGKTQYYENGKWKDVLFESSLEKKSSAKGTVKAIYKKTGRLDDPKYYTHFSISKLDNGRLSLQNYPESATWDNLLKEGTQMDAGNYLLVTGTRMANGSVLTHLTFFPTEANKEATLNMIMRENKDGVQVIGNFNSENLYFDCKEGTEKSLLSTTGRGYYIIGLITPNQEPTNHVLNDMAAYKKEMEKWGRKVILLFSNESEYKRFKPEEFPELPNTFVFGTDRNGTIKKEVAENMKLSNPDMMPVFLIADTFNRVVYISQGYTIGLGEQLMKVIDKLNE